MLTSQRHDASEALRRRMHLGVPGVRSLADTGPDFCRYDHHSLLLGIILQPRVPLVFGRGAPTFYLHRSRTKPEATACPVPGGAAGVVRSETLGWRGG